MKSKSSTQKIVVGLLSFAMVLTLVVGFSVAPAQADTSMTTTTTTTSSTSGYVFTRDLTVGSTGDDVTALQTLLNAKGFLAVTPTGYFGSLTKAALAAWQASVGISPAAGYFGPITRAWLASNMTTGVSMTPGCVAGAMFSATTGAPCVTSTTTVAGCVAGAMFSSTTGAPCTTTSTVPGCVAGAMFSATTGQSCTTGTTGTSTSSVWTPDGTDGSIIVSYVSYAPASQTLKKGDTAKPLISVKLQAVNGKTAVTRFDVHFSERPWLDFGQLELTDGSGNVLATKTLTSINDVTEVTVGTDYLVRFDNFNPIVVTPGNDMIVAVAGDVLAASDKITGQTVGISIPTDAIRTVNGKNYTDSVGLSATGGTNTTVTSGAVVNVGGNASVVTLSSTGSTAAVYTRIDPSSPATKRIVVTSTSQTTSGVLLGVFGLKSQNQNSTVNGLTFNLNTSGLQASTIYSNVRIQVNGQTYGSNQVGSSTTFTNLTIPLAQDQWVPVTLLADVQSNVTGVSASSTLVASGIVGVDANYNTINVGSATNQTSTDNQYSISGISVSNPTASIGTCTGSTSNTSNNKCSMTFSFTVTNVGNADIFISKTPAIALATSSSPSTASTTLQLISIAAGPGDTTQAYDVTSGGSRTFTYNGTFSQIAGGGFESFKITAINFGTAGTDGTDNTSSINFGLEPLLVSQTL